MAISEISLRDLVTEEEYSQRACNGVNPNIFYPPNPKDIPEGVTIFPTEEIAKRICAKCIVGDECLMTGVLRGEKEGIRNGQDLRNEIL